MSTQPDNSYESSHSLSVFIALSVLGTTVLVGREVMNGIASQVKASPEDIEYLCNGIGGCTGQSVFAGMLETGLALALLAVITFGVIRAQSTRSAPDANGGDDD